MIERYALSPMKEHWTLEAQYVRWLKVELAALHASESAGSVPKGTYDRASAAVHVDVDAFLREEAKDGHDLLAFVRVLERQAGDAGRHLHRGLTSSDVKDTALSLGLRDALDMLIDAAGELRTALRQRAVQHQDLVMVGRTHGMHAQPITLGLKVLVWERAVDRAMDRLHAARQAISVGRFAGPVGTQMQIPPEAGAAACEALGLRQMTGVSQILPRDLHADVGYALASFGAAMETIALELRHLSRTEVGELEEPRPESSSSLPHKRNPITSERICGLARVLRGNLQALMESIALWHERDMSHSSVERIVLPDSFLLAHYMTDKLHGIIKKLVVHEEAIERNLADAGDVLLSEAYLHALIDAGLPRASAHAAVRDAAHRTPVGGCLSEQLRDAVSRGSLPEHIRIDPASYYERVRAASRRILDAASREWDGL